MSQAEFDAGEVAFDVTDASTGAYSLTLDPGDYIVCEVLQADWTQSAPITAPPRTAPASPADDPCSRPTGYAITVTSGWSESANDFGNWTTGTKSGIKFEDLNGDGDQDDGVTCRSAAGASRPTPTTATAP